MPAIQGLMGTGDFAANQIPDNWRETVLYLEPEGDTPLIALSSMMATETTNSPKFHWWTKRYENRIFNTTALRGASTAGTSQAIPIDKFGFYCVAGVMLFVPATGEYLRVNTDSASDTSVTVTRGWGLAVGAATPAIPSGSQITVIGTMFAEGSGAPTAIQRIPFEDWNHTQIFKNKFNITRTAKRTKVRTGDTQYEENKMEALRLHNQDMERAAFFGIRHQAIDTNGEPVRSTGGLINFITTNVNDFGNAGTYEQLDTQMQSLFNFGSSERLGFCGNAFISRLNFLIDGRTNWNVNSPITMYGMKLNHITSPYGDLYFKRHPMLNLDPYYRNSAFIFDATNMKYRPLDDTFIMEDVQDNDADAVADMFVTEMGFEWHHEETFALWTNL